MIFILIEHFHYAVSHKTFYLGVSSWIRSTMFLHDDCILIVWKHFVQTNRIPCAFYINIVIRDFSELSYVYAKLLLQITTICNSVDPNEIFNRIFLRKTRTTFPSVSVFSVYAYRIFSTNLPARFRNRRVIEYS